MNSRNRTPEQIAAARARIAAHDARQAAFDAARKAPAVDALTVCNACDVEPMHDGCEAGYCSSCCPAH